QPTGSESLVLYKFDSCPYCQRILRQIEPLGLSANIELQDTRQDPKARAMLQERTGRTQVPCLFIDDKPLFESSDIADYLQAYSQAKAAQA
ncbi:MAG: glutaredoxin 3, partial [Cognaticolwellia sp.]